MSQSGTITTLTEALDSQRRLLLLGFGAAPLHALLAGPPERGCFAPTSSSCEKSCGGSA